MFFYIRFVLIEMDKSTLFGLIFFSRYTHLCDCTIFSIVLIALSLLLLLYAVFSSFAATIDEDEEKHKHYYAFNWTKTIFICVALCLCFLALWKWWNETSSELNENCCCRVQHGERTKLNAIITVWNLFIYTRAHGECAMHLRDLLLDAIFFAVVSAFFPFFVFLFGNRLLN